MSIARNTIFTAIGSVVTVAVMLFTVPVYLHLVGLERYGILAIVWAILTYFGLVELGVSGALVQRIASGKTSPNEKVDLYWTALAMNVVMGLLGGAALWLAIGPIISTMSFSTEAMKTELRSAGPLIAALLPVMTLRVINNGVLIGSQRFQASAVLSTLETISAAIVPLVVAAWFTVSLFWLILSILAVRIAFAGLSFLVMLPSLPYFRPRFPDIMLAKSLFSYGVWLTASSIIGPLMTYFDRFMIGSMLGVSQVPFYSIPQTLLQQVSHIPRALGTVLIPRFSSFENESAATELGIKAIQVMMIVMTPVCVVMILVIEPFLVYWLNEEFALSASAVAIVITLGAWPSALARIPISLLYGRNRPDLVVKAQMIELFPYFLLLFVMIQSYGILGVAIAWTFRVTVDMVLLGKLSGVLTAMIYKSLWPFLMLSIACLISGLQPMDSVLRWILAATLSGIVAFWVFRNMPPELLAFLNRVRVSIIFLPSRWFYKK